MDLCLHQTSDPDPCGLEERGGVTRALPLSLLLVGKVPSRKPGLTLQGMGLCVDLVTIPTNWHTSFSMPT